MSAVVTDCRDFVLALERAVPWGLHPTTDNAVNLYLSEMRHRFEDPVVVHEFTHKICRRVVQELEFTAENAECVGFYRDAWRTRRQAERFAARFDQPCEPIRTSK
jgi:hypothetical protein